jgi:hypothetical protein
MSRTNPDVFGVIASIPISEDLPLQEINKFGRDLMSHMTISEYRPFPFKDGDDRFWFGAIVEDWKLRKAAIRACPSREKGCRTNPFLRMSVKDGIETIRMEFESKEVFDFTVYSIGQRYELLDHDFHKIQQQDIDLHFSRFVTYAKTDERIDQIIKDLYSCICGKSGKSIEKLVDKFLDGTTEENIGDRIGHVLQIFQIINGTPLRDREFGKLIWAIIAKMRKMN